MGMPFQLGLFLINKPSGRFINYHLLIITSLAGLLILLALL